MRNTSISFANHTWNPFRSQNLSTNEIGWSCVKHGPGCLNCYAESLNKKLGTRLPFTTDAMNEVTHFMSLKGQTSITFPLSLKDSGIIFANSMTDWLWNAYPVEWSVLLFGIMSLATNQVFVTLTKRYERLAGLLGNIAMTPNRAINLPALKRVNEAFLKAHKNKNMFDLSNRLQLQLTLEGTEAKSLPLLSSVLVPFTPRNIIFGASATTESEMQTVINMMKNFRKTFPNLRTMISYEPALEVVDLSRLDTGDIDWIDVGGESDDYDNQGAARPFDIESWFEVARFGDRTGTPVFFKQAGSDSARKFGFSNSRGENIDELPANWLVRREYPPIEAWTV